MKRKYELFSGFIIASAISCNNTSSRPPMLDVIISVNSSQIMRRPSYTPCCFKAFCTSNIQSFMFWICKRMSIPAVRCAVRTRSNTSVSPFWSNCFNFFKSGATLLNIVLLSIRVCHIAGCSSICSTSESKSVFTVISMPALRNALFISRCICSDKSSSWAMLCWP